MTVFFNDADDHQGKAAGPDRTGSHAVGLAERKASAVEVTEKNSGKKRGMNRFIPVILVLAGILVFLYPIVATQYNNMKQQEFARKYSNEASSVPSEKMAEQFQAARDYNSHIESVPILDPWLSEVSADPNSDQYELYMAQLNELSAMARLQVPSVNIDLPIYHGTGDETLAKGVGHLYGTSLPVGGPGTHSVLTSHTGLSSATLFDHLKEV